MIRPTAAMVMPNLNDTRFLCIQPLPASDLPDFQHQ